MNQSTLFFLKDAREEDSLGELEKSTVLITPHLSLALKVAQDNLVATLTREIQFALTTDRFCVFTNRISQDLLTTQELVPDAPTALNLRFITAGPKEWSNCPDLSEDVTFIPKLTLTRCVPRNLDVDTEWLLIMTVLG